MHTKRERYPATRFAQRWRIPAASALGLLACAAPALAQDAATARSFYDQFLWSDDLLGQVIIWALLVTSLISIGYALKLFLGYRRAALVPADTFEAVERMIEQRRFREAIEYVNEDDSYLGRLVSAAMGEAGAGYDAMERAIEEEGDYETARMLRPVEYLNVVGNIAPMLGLFGTVYGMIRAFEQLVAAGGRPNPADLAGGISTALVTTFWGLIVAMPALAAYALVRNRIDALTSEGIVVAAELIRPFRPFRPQRGPRAAPPAHAPTGETV